MTYTSIYPHVMHVYDRRVLIDCLMSQNLLMTGGQGMGVVGHHVLLLYEGGDLLG